MDNLLTIALEAHHSGRNHHRRYEITVGRDLFDAWTVAICYGRAGNGGREDRFGGVDAERLKAVIRERLRRRLSAPKRIGVPYRMSKLSVAQDFDASGWLPGDIMTSFGVEANAWSTKRTPSPAELRP